MDEGLASVSAFSEERFNLQTRLLVVTDQLFVLNNSEKSRKKRERSQIHFYKACKVTEVRRETPRCVFIEKAF